MNWARSAAALPARATVLALGAYSRMISPVLPPMCRFYPSCSAYAREAIERYGLLRGCGKTLMRLCRCHPLHRGGFDPVR